MEPNPIRQDSIDSCLNTEQVEDYIVFKFDMYRENER